MPGPSLSADDAAYAAAVGALLARPGGVELADRIRSRTLLELLGRPDEAFPCLRVCGDVGKTSTARMVACLLGALGLSAGAVGGVHLQQVRERIRVATEPLTHEAFRDGLAYLAPFVDEVEARHPAPVTFEEVLLALACTHFADAPVDVAVFETASATDPSSILRSDVTVLGPCTEGDAGAWEQAAGARADQVTPVLVCAADVAAPTGPVSGQTAQQLQMVVAGRDFGVASRLPAVGGQLVDLQGVTGAIDGVFLPLHGAHQADNAARALAAVEGFLGFAGGLDPEVIRTGFGAVRAPGCVEAVHPDDAAPVVLDVARTPAAAAGLADALRTEFAFRHRILVAEPPQVRAAEPVLDALLPVVEHVVVSAGNAPAAADELAVAVEARGVSAEVADGVSEALEQAQGLAVADTDAVVVVGPAPFVGVARSLLGLEVA